MIGLMSVDDRNILAAIEYPPLVMRMLAPQNPEAFIEVHEQANQLASSLLQSGRRLKPRRLEEAVLPIPDDRPTYCELGLAAFGIYHLVMNRALFEDSPLTFFDNFLDRVQLIDVGYGPVWLYSSSQVAETAGQLFELSDAELRSRFSAETMEVLHELPREELEEVDTKYPDRLEWLMEGVTKLRVFLAKTTDEQRGMLVYYL